MVTVWIACSNTFDLPERPKDLNVTMSPSNVSGKCLQIINHDYGSVIEVNLEEEDFAIMLLNGYQECSQREYAGLVFELKKFNKEAPKPIYCVSSNLN